MVVSGHGSVGIKPVPSGRAAVLLTAEPSLQPGVKGLNVRPETLTLLGEKVRETLPDTGTGGLFK